MSPRVLLPLGVLGLASVVAVVLLATSSPIEGRPAPQVLRAVRYLPVETTTVQLDVHSQGTVSPRTESELIPEVSGPVVWTSPALVSGGYFREGEPLLRIDQRDYLAALERARAAVARTRGEHEHAAKILKRQQDLAKRDVISSTALDDALRSERVTRADLREARAALEQAERDLARTEIRAPFSGRVREERVDVGQFVTRGSSFATLYATDYLEVRLPVPDHQLAYLAPELWRAGADLESPPRVWLSARFAGEEHVWSGTIVRTEGEIDPRSRMVHVVARVGSPLQEAASDLPAPPLAVGLFVQARIEGRAVEDLVVVPRAALQSESQVLVIDAEDRLRFREIDVLRTHGDEVLVRRGLETGERVCISLLANPVDGMRVRPLDSTASGAPQRATTPEPSTPDAS